MVEVQQVFDDPDAASDQADRTTGNGEWQELMGKDLMLKVGCVCVCVLRCRDTSSYDFR
jgi:hypothetical protein